MAGRKAERRVRSKRRIPHIPPSDASLILERCEQILEGSRELLANLRSIGIAELFARLDDSVLQLAIQPDSWGERTRARLMSDLAPALCAPLRPGSAVNIEDVVRVTNAVTPCLLLEHSVEDQLAALNTAAFHLASGGLLAFDVFYPRFESLLAGVGEEKSKSQNYSGPVESHGWSAHAGLFGTVLPWQGL
jgi:hypothetical protein